MNDHWLTPEAAPPNRNAFKIAGVYLLIGGLWILFSDALVLALTRDPVLLNRLSIFKGWVFMAVTALLLYWLIRRHTAGLSESEARYRSLFQNNHSVMLLIDPQSGAIVDANPSACTFYGYNHPEITGLQITDINQLSREQVFVEMERARQEERRHFHFRHRLASGDIRPVEVYSGPIEVQGKQLLYSIVHDISERKLAEEQFRLVVETAHSAFLLVNQDHRITLVNGQAETLFGYSRDELIGQSIELLIPPPVRDQHHHYREAFFAAPQTQMLGSERNIFGWHKDGRPVPLQVGLTPLATAAGTQVLTTIIDLSERQQAEAALLESEEKYRTLLEALADGVFVAQDYHFVFANPALPAMLGYTPEAFVGLPFEAVIAPEFLPIWTERFTQRIASGPEPLKHYEVRFLCNGGGRSLWVELRASRIEYQDRPAVMGIIRDITERKKAQETLRENEERLRLALMAANQGLFDLNIQTGEAQVSPEYATMLGYDPATFHETNAAWIERLHPDDRQPVADNYRAYVAGEVPAYAVEFRQRTQGGGWKWILSLGKIVAWDREGRPLRMVGTHTDINERKQAEQQLLYQANLLQNVSDAIIATDANFKITSWNRAAEMIYGWSAAEVMGLSTTDLLQTEHVAEEPEEVRRLFQEQGFWQGEATQKHKTGTTINIMASVSLIRDGQGRATGAVAVNRDISERRRAEAQLRRATTELMFMNDLLKHSTQPISVANMQGRFVRFNQAFEQLTGYQEEELLQLTYEQLTPEPWHEIEAQQITNLLATGQAVRFEKEYRGKDGTVTPVELVVELYRDPQGVPLYTYGFATDISERKRAEAALRESEERLAFALEVGQMGSWEFNLVDHSAYRSLQHSRIFGYETPEQTWTFEMFLGHIIPEDRAEVERIIGQAIAAKSDWSIECRIRRCDGEIRWIWVAGRYRSDAAGGSHQMVGGIVLDITERKQAEQALQTASRRFQIILSALYGGILVVSNDHCIEFANPAFCDMFDLGDLPEVLLGLSATEMIQKIKNAYADPPLAIARIREILAAGQPLKGEEIAMVGGRTYLRDFIPIIIDGKEYGRLWHHLDITARQQAEAALRQSEENFSKAFKSSPAALLLTRLADGQFIELNGAYCTIVGYDRVELIGRQTTEFNIYLDSTQRQDIIDQLRASGSVRDFETSIRHRSGAIRHVVANQEIITFNGEVCILSNLLDITERKRAEEKLRASEAKFKAVFDNAPVGISLLDAERNLLESNDMLAQIVRMDEARLVTGAYRARKYIREDGTEIPVSELASMRAIVERRAIHDVVNGIVLEDGETIWTQVSAAPLGLGDPRFVVITQNITARKQTEAHLRELQNMLAMAEAVAGMGSWKWDLQTQKVTWSDEMFNLFGVDRAKFDSGLDRVIASRIHPDDIEAVNQSNVAVLEAGQPKPLEYRIVLPDGTQRDVWAEGTLIHDSSGRPVALTGYVQDITARKQVEVQIQAQARRLQTLADTSRAFAEVGTDYQTVLQLIAHHIGDHLNAGCVIRLLSEDEQWLETIIVYDQDPAALEVTETTIRNTRYHIIKDATNPAVQAFRTGQPLLLPIIDPELMRPFYPPEQWLILEPYCPRSALIAPLQVQKQALGVLSFSRYRLGQSSFNQDDLRLVQDLADRAALALSNARLFGQVQDELVERKRTEEDLRRTATELARSNADLEQFAYVASHDLQEPLRAVAGTVQLLQKRYGGQLDERADEFIHHAVEGATRMQTLINDLLVFSRVGTRGQPFRSVELADVLADVKANLTVAIRESGAVISHDNLPTLVADRTQLIQLFQNLIANAIKFRGERVPEIRIRVERQQDEWLFAVADNGIGLEAEYYERIFGVFQRLHTRREYPGTGIGLALCKKIVERHGGRIWVESEPGQGSTFYFTLPVQ